MPEPSPLVITYRSHHNAYTEGDGSGATILRNRKSDSAFYRYASILVGLCMMHYFLWIVPMLLMLWIPYQLGYPLITGLLVGLYIPTYFRKDELIRGRQWEWLRQHPIFKLLQHYGDVEVVREAELDRERKYIFGYHPHGILILSRIGTYGGLFEKLFPGIDQRCLGATPMFNFPGSREACLWLGAVRADRSNAVRLLSKENFSLLLYPGGSEEIFLTKPESKVTEIIARKGFIRLALQHGCDLVPTFVFGERQAYRKLDIPKRIKYFFMKTLRMPLIVFWGRFYSWLPVKNDSFFLSIVHGVPIRVEGKVENPSDREIDALYDKFYDEVQKLFYKYKGKYGYGEDETLVIREAPAKSIRTSATTGENNEGSKGKSLQQ